MFSLMLQKLFHKKWMLFCLLIGNILLISVAISHPLYRTSSFQRMLTDEFKAYEESTGEWPTTFSLTYRKSGKTQGTAVETVQAFVDKAGVGYGVGIKHNIRFFTLNEIKLVPETERYNSKDRSMRISYLSDINDHVELVAGRYPEDGISEEGYLEVMVSRTAEQAQDLLLDETYTSEKFTEADGTPIRIKVVGIFVKLNEDECYWQDSMDTLKKEGFITEATFNELFLDTYEEQTYYGLNMSWYQVWDYSTIRPSDVKRIRAYSEELANNKNYSKAIQESNYAEILDSYSTKAKKVEASLLILQIPALLLLCSFLYMISGQMLEMEQNEISILKSRGATRTQIVWLYVMQSVLVGLISLIAGIPLGRLICMVLGSTSNFLEFSVSRELSVQYSTDIVYYAAGAFLVGVMMTVIPVIGYSRVGIVNLKQGKHKGRRSLWKMAFLDIICLGIALYGYYNYMRNRDSIMQDILAGESLDPMIYLSSSLFILGAGLFLIRIQPMLIKLFFKLFKNLVKPSTYASLVGTLRSGKKQEFIMLFMIMTVALGIYNATVARTIVANAEANATYLSGADVVLKEKWKDNSLSISEGDTEKLKYTEPDYNRYGLIQDFENHTKVLRASSRINSGKVSVTGTIMGIIPAEFAKVTSLDGEMNPYDFYDYLNVLASVENGALVSENFMIKNGLSLGDFVTFQDANFGRVTVRIYGFFTYWPTYEPYTYVTNKDGSVIKEDNYLVVTNLVYVQDKWGVTPYEIWAKTDNTEPLYEFIAETPKLKIAKFSDLSKEKEYIRTDTLFQGTNGILTMSFAIVLLLCAVGYLIYWIMSIRSRELLFGILRAMGMKKREITWMLILEQICCGLYSILAGTIVGFLSAKLYVPLVQSAYAADNQVLPLTLIMSRDDITKLFAVILGVMLVCLFIIGRIVSRMNISSALKLGED